MNRIAARFAELKQRNEAALIPFLTAGDPDVAATEQLLLALAEAGADLIELGMPFSDPMADGPTIQASSLRALQGGMTLRGTLDLVARVRQRTQVPLVLMGYFNPVFRYGIEAFARDAAAAGVDGLLLVDLPPEQAEEVAAPLRAAGIDRITLLAPTTPPERMARLAAQGEGFLYYVSMTGVTGTRQVDPTEIEAAVGELRQLSSVPVAVGFGVSTPADAAAIARLADAVVVGSALVRVIERCGGGPELVPQVTGFIRDLKQAVRAARG